MANKIIAILLALMLLCVMPIALADDINENIVVDANITAIDEQEARSILAPYGAEVRLLQLEKSVTRNILIGDAVLKVLDKNNNDANLIDAENTLNALEMLLDEIKTTPREGDKNLLVQTYVELKKEARTLVADFKNETKDLITPSDRNEIMAQLSDLDRNSFIEINKAIKEKARNFNAEKMNEHFKAIGIRNDSMLAKIRNGDINAIQEAKKYALDNFKDLNIAEKKQIATKMRNDSIKRTIEGKEIINKIKLTLEQKLMNSIQNRIEDLNAWIERKGIDANTLGRMQREERLREQIDRIQEMVNSPNGDLNRERIQDLNKQNTDNNNRQINGGGRQ